MKIQHSEDEDDWDKIFKNPYQGKLTAFGLGDDKTLWRYHGAGILPALHLIPLQARGLRDGRCDWFFRMQPIRE